MSCLCLVALRDVWSIHALGQASLGLVPTQVVWPGGPVLRFGLCRSPSSFPLSNLHPVSAASRSVYRQRQPINGDCRPTEASTSNQSSKDSTKMNASLKAAAVAESSRANLFQLRAALFHSTPVLERGRRQQGQPRFTYSRRPRKHKWKSHVLRNFNSYAEDLFESWIPFLEQEDPRNTGPSWFRRQQGASGSRSQGNPNHGHKARGRRGFQFCDEDSFNAETIFRSAFGGERISFWSFVNEDSARWRSSSAYTNGHRGRSWHWRIDNDDDDDDEEEESSSDTDSSESTSASDRSVLGLSPYGPLKLDDVKHAYRTCALKFHPDRHQGPSKNAAEEKFKSCTAAYQSLCDKLAVN